MHSITALVHLHSPTESKDLHQNMTSTSISVVCLCHLRGQILAVPLSYPVAVTVAGGAARYEESFYGSHLGR